MEETKISAFQGILCLYLPFGACGTVLVYLIARAVLLPMTCDEVQTCLAFSRYSVTEIMTYSRSAIPNNHIFHTLLVKLSTSIFGMKLWATRLPNLIGFVVYFFYSYRILTESVKEIFISESILSAPGDRESVYALEHNKSGWAVTIGMILLIANPYFLDFFSLARGYGLACAWMMGSLYYAWRYLKNKSNRLIALSLFFGSLAVYTNLTTLNYFVALTAYFSVTIVWDTVGVKTGKSKGGQALLLILFFSGLLAAALFEPIRRMRETNQFVFWGSKGFYEDTFVSLTQALLYNAKYFKASTEAIFRALILLLLLATAITAINIIRKKGGSWIKNPLVFTFFMICGAVIVNILQYHLVQTPYLQTRTALFFYPLTALPFALLVVHLFKAKRKIFIYFAGFLGFIWLSHLLYTFNMNSCREWWYDADTKNVLNVLKKTYDADLQKKKISLATNCLMQPSFWFHISEEGREGWIEIPAWDNKIHAAPAVDYYYTVSSEEEALKEKFDVIGRYNDRVLMKRKTNVPKQ